jgi:undecaprenyl pyrophosphate synthase
MACQMGLRHSGGVGVVRDVDGIMDLMQKKLDNSLEEEKLKRKNRDKLRGKLERLLVKKKTVYKKFVNKTKEKVMKLRKEIQKKNEKKIRMLKIRRKAESRFKLPNEIARYIDAEIFDDIKAGRLKPDKIKGPVIVGEDPTLLSDDEIAVLKDSVKG